MDCSSEITALRALMKQRMNNATLNRKSYVAWMDYCKSACAWCKQTYRMEGLNVPHTAWSMFDGEDYDTLLKLMGSNGNEDVQYLVGNHLPDTHCPFVYFIVEKSGALETNPKLRPAILAKGLCHWIHMHQAVSDWILTDRNLEDYLLIMNNNRMIFPRVDLPINGHTDNILRRFVDYFQRFNRLPLRKDVMGAVKIYVTETVIVGLQTITLVLDGNGNIVVEHPKPRACFRNSGDIVSLCKPKSWPNWNAVVYVVEYLQQTLTKKYPVETHVKRPGTCVCFEPLDKIRAGLMKKQDTEEEPDSFFGFC